VSGFEVVASVIAAFFFIGIGVGVLLVIALPALRRHRGAREIGWDGDYRRHGPPPGYRDNNGPGWEEPPGPDDGDNSPRWPRRRR
jgi:hypothetical protein